MKLRLLCTAGIFALVSACSQAAPAKFTPRGPNAILDQANVALNSGQLDAADRFFGQALGVNPNDTHALYGMAIVNERRGNMSEASALLGKVVSLGKGEIASWRVLKGPNVRDKQVGIAELASRELFRIQRGGMMAAQPVMMAMARNAPVPIPARARTVMQPVQQQAGLRRNASGQIVPPLFDPNLPPQPFGGYRIGAPTAQPAQITSVDPVSGRYIVETGAPLTMAAPSIGTDPDLQVVDIGMVALNGGLNATSQTYEIIGELDTQMPQMVPLAPSPIDAVDISDIPMITIQN